MDKRNHLQPGGETSEYGHLDIDRITEARLREKNTYFSKFALLTRKPKVRFSFILITASFIFIIISIAINVDNTEISFVMLILLVFSVYALFNLIGRQRWDMEKSRTMRELSPLSIKTLFYTLTIWIRWIYPLAALLLFIFIILGVLKGY